MIPRLPYIIIMFMLCLPYVMTAQATNPNQSKIDSLHKVMVHQGDPTGELALEIASSQPRGESDTSMFYLNKAIQKAFKQSNKQLLVKAYNQKAWIFVTPLHKFDSCQYYAELALNLQDTTISTKQLYLTYNYLGISRGTNLNLGEGLLYFKKAARVCLDIQELCSYATSLHNIAKCYKYIKNDSLANKYYYESLHQKQKNHCSENYSYLFFNIGNVYSGKLNIDSTLYYMNQAMKMDSSFGSTDHVAPAYLTMGKLYNSLADYDQAIHFLNLAYHESMKTKNPSIKKYVFTEFAKYHANIANMDSILTYVNKAKNYHKVSPDLNIILDSLQYVYFLHKEDHSQALHYFQKYQNESDSLERSNLLVQLESYQSARKDDQIKLLEQENEIIHFKERWTKMILMTLSALFLLSIGFYTYYMYISRKKHKLTLQLIEAEKNLENQKLRHKLLLSQINPHFIFNTLNAIKYHVLLKNKEDSSSYITDFSHLIRGVLEHSNDEYICLQDDIDWLKSYIAMERRRFKDPFLFELNIDPSLNTYSEKIPPLIIQPFVENAIWHGLSHKSNGSRAIKLTYETIPNGYVVKVSDNGIGRKASELLQNTKQFKSKSMGMSITNERIRQINNAGKMCVKIHVEDLSTENISDGTEVIITFEHQT